MNIASTIKKMVVKIGDQSQLGSAVYHWVKYSTAKFLGAIWTEERYAKWFYHLYTGKQLQLENPQHFDEKVWWLKLNNRDPMLTLCSDKNSVRGYVAKCGLADILIPQHGTLANANELDPTSYDEEVIVKCNHNSGGYLICDPKVPLSDKDLRNGRKKLNFILKQNASVLSREWNYKNIPPCLVVEKVIRDKQGNLPLDYKFMCFDGVPKLLFLDLGLINEDKSYNHDYPRNIYDMDFNLLPVKETRENAPYPVEKPRNFERMVQIARKLSQPFPFCRVDLYNVDGDIYFGEITFYHGGGCNNIQPEEWDLKMGSWIDIHNPKIVKKN